MIFGGDYQATGSTVLDFQNQSILDAYFKKVAGLKATITTSFDLGLRAGDKLTLSCDTNRVRRRISAINSATQIETVIHLRPSKGFRRHVRLIKAAERGQNRAR